MNNLCTDISFKSLNKYTEQLCGDHIDLVDQGENSLVLVLADGMGSGVKANILSTLTSKIISTMMAQNMDVEECVHTIAATLPVCAVREVAYSTFTIIRIIDNKEAEIIQYDNPHVILIRNGEFYEFPKTSKEIDGKIIYSSRIQIQEDDVFIAMSDGVIHAGVGEALNFGWERDDIIKYMTMMYDKSYTAKILMSFLLEECNRLYGNKPGDDTTVAVVKVRKKSQVNVLFGPPSNRDDVSDMMNMFFTQEGLKIVCGGTTSTIAAEYLGEEIIVDLDYMDSDIPPTAKIKGIDIVTEGVITMTKVLEYAEDYSNLNERYSEWSYKKDGASQIARMLFEDATDVNFFVGRAVNPAHQNPNLPITFNIKMRIVDEMCKHMKIMGKKVKVKYF